MKKRERLIGKTVLSVKKTKSHDHGVLITFTDGSRLEIAYNNFEGFTTYTKAKDV